MLIIPKSIKKDKNGNIEDINNKDKENCFVKFIFTLFTNMITALYKK